MTKEIIFSESSNPKLKLYAGNEQETYFLQDLYILLSNHDIACNYDKGNFHYGLIINLIKDERFRIFHDTYPKKGEIYVIRGTVDFGIENCPVKGLYLVGIESKNNTNGKEQAWNSFDFKLLKDAKNNKFSGEYDWLNKDNE
jgi:hypothetical protein